MDTPEVCNGDNDNDNDDRIPLPGFRFHPTDEELVRFYLRRKVEKRPIRLELIKEMDIYKHDPWDLPCKVGDDDKECYFYCKRGRKYKKSIRPNRVTGSGFWKATGIDKPVYYYYSNIIIGLKKTLVYYRGTAAKATKTDWMMHEFRLPPPPASAQLEAEIWTLCRIFKRNVISCRRYGISNNWSKQQQTPNKNTKQAQQIIGAADQKSSGEISYINFSCESMIIQNDHKPVVLIPNYPNNQDHQWNNYQYSSSSPVSPPIGFPTNQLLDINDFFTDSNWDELRSVVNMF